MTENLFIGSTVIHLSEVDSTNNYARALIRDKMPIEGTVVVADEQTAGRGQRSNSWVSEPNSNLMCSYILRPAFLAAKDQFALSAAVALSVSDLVSELLGDEIVRIKWPNDILINGNKVAGILIENTLRGSHLDSSIVGIGLNVNQTEFEGVPTAISLKLISKKAYDLNGILMELNNQLESRYLMLREGKHKEILRLFNDRLFATGETRMLKINDLDTTVTIVGTRPSGELELEHEDGRSTLHQHHEIGWYL